MDLTSGRLIFHSLSPGDFPLYYQLARNGDVMKYITGKALNPEEAEQRFQVALYATRAYPEAGFFIVKSRFENDFVGVVKLVQFDCDHAEVGYMLLPEHWGKGYASEMVECLIRLAREKKMAAGIVGIVDPENPASIRVLKKFGFQLYESGQIDGMEADYYRLELADGHS